MKNYNFRRFQINCARLENQSMNVEFNLDQNLAKEAGHFISSADDLLLLLVTADKLLNSSSDAIRYNATLFVEVLLERVVGDAPECYSALSLHHWVMFFCSRATDYPSLSPVLQGLSFLLQTQLHRMDSKYCDCIDIIKALGIIYYHSFYISIY